MWPLITITGVLIWIHQHFQPDELTLFHFISILDWSTVRDNIFVLYIIIYLIQPIIVAGLVKCLSIHLFRICSKQSSSNISVMNILRQDLIIVTMPTTILWGLYIRLPVLLLASRTEIKHVRDAADCACQACYIMFHHFLWTLPGLPAQDRR